MLFALVDGVKHEATPKSRGKCPLCQQEVLSKCGEIKVWHWAHYKDESCDSWYEPETEWHKNWKLIFGKDNCEIVISKNGTRHIGDVLTKGNVIIELQNSPIQKSVIRSREIFFGEKMIWVVNGKHFKDNFWIPPSRFYFDKNYLRTSSGFINKTTGETVPFSQSKVNFTWSWARQSWKEVQRPLFIDFGDENLFWVKKGMGMKNGNGIHVNKKKFIKKYGGDTSLLSLIIEDLK